MLNYKNDPLLLDKETVNDLIRKGKENLIFLDKEKGILNLYSAFVKKNDFIKRDKLSQPLQKTVYVKISQKLTNEINKKFPDKKQLKKLIEQYTGRRSVVNAKWFKNNVFPFILLRIISKNDKELSVLMNEIKYFTDFVSRSKFYHPKTLNNLLNIKTAYLVGCSVGDGHISKDGKKWCLVDGSSDEKRLVLSEEFVFGLKSLVENFVGIAYVNKFKTKYVVGTNNKLFCRFLNFFFSLPYGAKKKTTLMTPLILKFSKTDLKKYFWKGLFDTDGSAVKSGVVTFSSIDKNLLDECKNYLKSLGINPTLTEKNLNISMQDLKKWNYIGFAHPRKQIEFLATLELGATFKSVKIKEGVGIDERLKAIQNVLRVDKEGYRIRINSVAIRKEKMDIKFVQYVVNELFGHKFKKASNDLYYFKSKKVYDYLRSLFIYEPAWEAISEEDENQLLYNWNDVWLK